MTQNNLGITLQEQGSRTRGEEGQRLLRQAVTAYRAALEVRLKESSPRQWAQTHNNLAEAAMALGEWEEVATSYSNVLELYPDDAEAYSIASEVFHENLFRYGDAFSLNQQWLEGHSDDLSAHMDFAKGHLTTGRFSEAEQRFSALLARSDLVAESFIPLHLLYVVSLVAQNKMDVAVAHLEEIKTSLGTLPEDFALGWSFEGSKHFISQHEAFVPSRAWLVALLEGFSGKTRDEMLAAVKVAQAQLEFSPSP